jgi:hypothetical protein
VNREGSLRRRRKASRNVPTVLHVRSCVDPNVPVHARFRPRGGVRSDTCGGPAMAKIHRCPATSTRFWFVAPPATRSALLLQVACGMKQQSEVGRYGRRRGWWFVKGKARVPWAHADHRPTEHRLARPRRLLERRSSCLGRAAFELDTTAAKRQYGQRRVVCADFRFDQSASRERLASPSSSASLCYVESYRLVAARKGAPWPRTLTPAAGSDLSGARTGDAGADC